MTLSVSFQLLKSAAIRRSEYAEPDLAALAHYVLSRERVRGAVNLALDFTNPRRIQALNRRFRGVDRNTDVISFRYDSRLSKRGFDGDIAINVDQARRQARKMRHPARREIRLLWIHGLLHLLGYTDYEPKPRRKMFKRQNELLRRWEKQAR
jgi:probable rRNA maturation factor